MDNKPTELVEEVVESESDLEELEEVAEMEEEEAEQDAFEEIFDMAVEDEAEATPVSCAIKKSLGW